MAHECACHSGTTTAKADAGVTASQTVREAARRSPAALAVLEQMGINHCCGGGLTLREAAAAAGVPIERLLAALNEATGAPA